MNGIRLVNVKRFARGAKWSDGEPRMCVRCGVERTRRHQAVITAELTNGSPYRVPVAYCPRHEPELS